MNRYNHYDVVIQDLRYYVNDKRRSKEYRGILAQALSALESANLELKEAQNLLCKISNVTSTTSNVLDSIKQYTNLMEERK